MKSRSSSESRDGKGPCEYRNQCSLYREDGATCAESTSDEREYCGVYRKRASQETIWTALRRGIDNLVEDLKVHR